MGTYLQLILHQFRRENREHWWFLVGYGFIIFGFTTLGATSMLEEATDHWGRPLLMDNEELYLFISLIPALFFVPFLAFSDPTDDPEAFWLTKPTGARIIVFGKILWILVWLIGMPLLGECITIASLGGVSKLGYVAVDYIYLRTAFVFSAFALGCVANHPLRLVVGLICIPILLELIGVWVTSISTNPQNGIPYAPAISLSWVWIGTISLCALGIALAQYRWRRPLSIGVPAVVTTIALAIWIERRPVDLSTTPGIASNSPFAAVTMQLHSARIHPGKLTVDGVEHPRLKARAVVENVPHSYTIGVIAWDLIITADGKDHRLKYLSHDWKRFHDDVNDRERVFHDIVERLKEGPQKDTTTLNATIEIKLPANMGSELAQADNISIGGRARLDCFAYHEFAFLKPAPYDGPTFPPSNVRVASNFETNGTRLTLGWPAAPGNSRQVSVQARRISASLDPDNEDPRVRSHNHVQPWYYIPRNTDSGEYWESYHEQYTEAYRMSVRNPLHLTKGWFSIPSSFPANEIAVFKARYVGQRTVQINSPASANR